MRLKFASLLQRYDFSLALHNNDLFNKTKRRVKEEMRRLIAKYPEGLASFRN